MRIFSSLIEKLLFSGLLAISGFFLLLSVTFAQTNASLPVAITVPVSGVTAAGGELVVYNIQTGVYAVSRTEKATNVFGVTVERPPLVFATASNTAAVITQGAAYLKVNNSRGQIARGDLLVSAAAGGTAAKAELEDEAVIALALEDAVGNESTILVQFDQNAAKVLAAERRQAAEEAENASGLFGTTSASADEKPGIIKRLFSNYTRSFVAAVIAVGSLFFVMYTFRTTIINATQAVGRNPRARNAIMTVSVENIIFALVIFALAIFIAIAVLVLPV
jgi:hypothetical protein